MKENILKYRLGLDLGTNSIGWCMLRLNKDNEPVAVIKSGVRIFHDGRNEKTKEPLAVLRRNARSIRRNLDRKISRRNHLLNTLIKYSLLPENEDERKSLVLLNPYELRSKAVNEKIELYGLGRALMHLSKRRGFKSNRKVDKEESSGKIKPAIEKLKEKMRENNKKTAGEYLYFLLQNGQPVRARLGKIDGKEGYEIYLDRSIVEDEYKTIMNEQKKYYKELSDEVINNIFNIIFYQRPLKLQKVGKCSIFPDDIKLRKAHVISQNFILLQKIQDLRVFDDNIMEFRPLNPDEKSILKRELQRKKEIKFEDIRKLLKKYFENGKYGMFSHETTDKIIYGNKTNVIMANKEVIGSDWYDLDPEKQYNVIALLFSEKNNDELIRLYKENFQFTEEQINGLLNKAIYRLDSGYISYGKKAVLKLNSIMDNENIDLHHARIEAGFESSKTSEAAERLEYYGKVLPNSVVDPQIDYPKNDEEIYGKIANPTVHAALNQLRKVVNELLELYGRPEQIVIELARDLKNSRKAKDLIKKKNAENKKLNEEVDKIIQEYSEQYHTQIVKNKLNRDKIKLWFELGDDVLSRKCIYTGEQISISKLFSDDVQIEHIVPYSKTLDDSMNNKTLSMKKANYYKGNRTPYEAFKDNKDGYNYEAILERAKQLNNSSKFKRFTKEAMEIYGRDGKDFIARQLSDTQYLSKLALSYLQSLYPESKHSALWTIPGQLTSLIRNYLGLNNLISEDESKNRNDHRHHAIDAFVVAVTSRSMLQKISYAASLQEDFDNRNLSSYRNKLLEKMPEPFSNFRKSLQISINNIKTSHKADRSISGKLHGDTAYGLVKDNEKYNLVSRQKITDNINKELIRDQELRRIADNNELFENIIKERKIWHLRILKKFHPIIEIKDKNKKTFKVYTPENNICAEVYEVPNDKRYVEVINLYDASQVGFEPKWRNRYPTAKLIMRLFKGDIIGYLDGERYRYMVIKSIKVDRFILQDININIRNAKTEQEREVNSMLSKKHIINSSYNPFVNVLKAKQFNISPTGIVTKKKTADINFWKNRK